MLSSVPTSPSLAQPLARGIDALALAVDASMQARLLQYLALLEKWNQVYNLTAVRDPAQMVPRHLLDSLAIMPFLRGQRVLDIGTGAGLPGIPLAIARPELHFVLLDSNAKKIRFVTQATHELGLGNVEAVQMAVEKYAPPARFDTLLTRAFAAIPDMLNSSRHLCAAGGAMVAMKGVFPQEELAGVSADFVVREVRALQVPGLDAARHVVVIESAVAKGA